MAKVEDGIAELTLNRWGAAAHTKRPARETYPVHIEVIIKLPRTTAHVIYQRP